MKIVIVAHQWQSIRFHCLSAIYLSNIYCTPFRLVDCALIFFSEKRSLHHIPVYESQNSPFLTCKPIFDPYDQGIWTMTIVTGRLLRLLGRLKALASNTSVLPTGGSLPTTLLQGCQDRSLASGKYVNS